MVKINDKQKDLLENVAMSFATGDKDGNPNVVAVACVKVVAKNKILITDNFFNKTRRNLLKNDNVSIAIWSKDEEEGWQFKGTAEYIRSGKWKKYVDEMKENEGLAHKAAVLVTVKEIFDLANP